jgi:hypothetical protein
VQPVLDTYAVISLKETLLYTRHRVLTCATDRDTRVIEQNLCTKNKMYAHLLMREQQCRAPK